MGAAAADGPRPSQVLRRLRLLLLAAVLALPAACGREDQQEVAEVRPIQVMVTDTCLSGNVQPESKSSLSFRIGGRMMERHVGVGGHVRPGQLVAQLDPQDEQRGQQVARAAQRRAGDGRGGRQQISAGCANWSRRTRCRAPCSTRPGPGAGHRATRPQVESAQAQVRLADNRLSYMHLVSDVAGVVTACGAEPGEVAAAEQIEFVPTSLPDDVAKAYRILDRESDLRTDGVEDDPGADRESFDPQQAYARGRSETASFGSGGARKALLSPLVQLSFWKMKARAKRIGENGGFALLSSMMRAAADREVRIHLMGHGFGYIASSAPACGPSGANLPRPMSSLILAQGALSLWSCCDRLPGSGKPGYFRRLASSGVVAGPIVTTRSERDMAAGSLYPVPAGVARRVDFAADKLPKYGGVGSFGCAAAGWRSTT